MYRALPRFAIPFGIVALSLQVANGFAGEIYRCTSHGQTILSDQKTGDCQAMGALHVNVADSLPVASHVMPHTASKGTAGASTVKRGQADSTANAQLAAKQRCQRIDGQLAEVQAKLRAGYNLQQGEKLRERQRSLQEKRSIERCR